MPPAEGHFKQRDPRVQRLSSTWRIGAPQLTQCRQPAWMSLLQAAQRGVERAAPQWGQNLTTRSAGMMPPHRPH
jgi:hypothetical protein